MQKNTFTILLLTLLLTTFVEVNFATAQTRPDAGQAIQQINQSLPSAKKVPTLPKAEEKKDQTDSKQNEVKETDSTLEKKKGHAPKASKQIPITIESFEIISNSAVSTQELQPLLQNILANHKKELLKQREKLNREANKLEPAFVKGFVATKEQRSSMKQQQKQVREERQLAKQQLAKFDKFYGNEVYGEKFTLAQLQQFADAVTDFYHEKGYPLTKAIIPAQKIQKGVLTIEVIEGAYGEARVTQSNVAKKDVKKFAFEAEKFLNHNLQSGSVVRAEDLERTMLILNDLPGFKFTSTLAAGKKPRATDLAIAMEQQKKYGGNISFNNYGNRYMGTHQAMLSVYDNSVLRFGDQLTLSTMKSQGDLFYGALGYSTPIGYKGLKLNTSYSRTNYELGKEYQSLDSHGISEIFSTGLSYPIKRSQTTNLALSTTYNHKWFTDEQNSSGKVNKKRSNTLPIALSFDKKDDMLGGGVNYGSLTWTQGVIDLGNNLKTTDDTTAKSDGYFSKVNFDFNRIQATKLEKLTTYVHAFGQFAQNNLDSSEKFGIGGPTAVRAYPTGEGYGDEGYVVQAEVRYSFNDKFTPFAFYDIGNIKTNHNPWTTDKNHRTIAGAGLGVRVQYQKIDLSSTIGWKTTSNSKPTSDSKAKTPIIWFNAGYQF